MQNIEMQKYYKKIFHIIINEKCRNFLHFEFLSMQNTEIFHVSIMQNVRNFLHFQLLSYLSQKIGLDIACKLSKPIFWEK